MITVVTHHNPKRDISIKRCIQSVDAALQPGDKHLFIECDGTNYNDYAKARFDSLKLGDYVCFVDDDDYIPENVLADVRKCIIDNPDVGLYYTRECKVISNDIIHCKAGEKYENLIISPTGIHHLSIFNTKYIDNEILDLAFQVGCGVEWIMRCWFALQYGAIHIPIDGYYYCFHDSQLYKRLTKNFFNHNKLFKSVFAGWQKHYGQIPIYTLPEY